MTEQEAYQEHIRYTHDTYCRIVIRHASFDAARPLAAVSVRPALPGGHPHSAGVHRVLPDPQQQCSCVIK